MIEKVTHPEASTTIFPKQRGIRDGTFTKDVKVAAGSPGAASEVEFHRQVNTSVDA
jgi:hypothetical protein